MTRKTNRRDGRVLRQVMVHSRNWDWAKKQPGGASATLDKLANTARKMDERRNALDQLTDLRLENAALKNEIMRLKGE